MYLSFLGGGRNYVAHIHTGARDAGVAAIGNAGGCMGEKMWECVVCIVSLLRFVLQVNDYSGQQNHPHTPAKPAAEIPPT